MLRETWSLGDVEDVEGFCGAVIAKFTRGERVAHQFGSDAFFSPSDKEDLLAFLLAASWQAWLKFDPVDDGRGLNKFSGWLVWVLHRRVVDWIRKRYGSNRYGPVPVFTLMADPELHISEAWHDPEYDDSDALDLDSSPDGTREALELLQPLLDGEAQSFGQVAERAQVEPAQVAKAIQLVRAEARRQGLEPASVADEDRQELADRARELRELGMHYREIGAELCLLPQAVSPLLREYHPEVVKGRRREAIRAQR